MSIWGPPLNDAGELEATYRDLGTIFLDLVSGWDAWISRRVDSFHFAGDDERVLHRRQSVDFTRPDSLAKVDPDLVRTYGGLPLPITFVSKWRLPEFSMRDRNESTVSLLHRNDSTPIAAGMLIALASFVHSKERSLAPGRDGIPPMPPRLQRTLYSIASGEPTASLRRCIDFQDSRLAPADEVQWRKSLVESELFMSLAFELAGSFLLSAVVPEDPALTRQVLKFSYNSYVIPAERDLWRVRLRHAGRWALRRSRDAIDPSEWRRSSSRHRIGARRPSRAETATIVISSKCEGEATQLHYGAPSIACAVAKIKGPDGTHHIRIRPSGVIPIAGLPPGNYRIKIENKSGYTVEGRRSEFTLAAGEERRLSLLVRGHDFTKPQTRATPAIAAVPWRGKWLVRELGWHSKPIAIRVRLGQGGSYHCEFEAPLGLHITRARLVSNLDGNEVPERENQMEGRRRSLARALDTVLVSTQRAHLYAPSGERGPATGYVYLNLRPRVDTVVRSATLTALFSVLILIAIALAWTFPPQSLKTDDPPFALLALLLGGPSALAAYFAQAIPSRVTMAMLFGIRLLSLVPLILSVLAAGAILVFGAEAGPALVGIAGLSAIAASAFAVTYWYAERPPEQRLKNGRQGHDFFETHRAPQDVAVPVTPVLVPATSGPEHAAAIRDHLLERYGGMTVATRRKLLGQRWFWWWEHDVSPALYFDSAEPPAVYLGPRSDESRVKLKEAAARTLRRSAPRRRLGVAWRPWPPSNDGPSPRLRNRRTRRS